jgi:hypothetical protein
MLREVPVPRSVLSKLLGRRQRRFRDENFDLRVSLGPTGEVRSFELFYDDRDRAKELVGEKNPPIGPPQWDWPLELLVKFYPPPESRGWDCHVGWDRRLGFGFSLWMQRSERARLAADFTEASVAVDDTAIRFIAERLRELALEAGLHGRIDEDEAERHHLLTTLQRAHGNHTEAAKLLGMSVTSMRGLLKAYSLETESPEAARRRRLAALMTWATIVTLLALAWLGK